MKNYISKFEKWFSRFSSIFVILLLICLIKVDYYVYLPGNLTNIESEVVMDNTKELNGKVSSVYVLSITRPTILQYLVSKSLNCAKIVKMTESQKNSIDTKLDNAIGVFDSNRSFSEAELAAYSLLHEREDFYQEITYIYSATSDIKSTTHEYTKVVGKMVYQMEGLDKLYPTITDITNYLKDKDDVEFILEDSNGNQEDFIISRKEDGYFGLTFMKSFMLTVESFTEVKSVYTQGPSGGAMQALYIYLNLIDEDLLKGRNIAGTGTISYSLNEDSTIESFDKVGAIGCVEQKLFGAFLDDAEVFYCPASNYDDCMEAYELYGFSEDDIRVVKVEYLEDIINDLRGTNNEN